MKITDQTKLPFSDWVNLHHTAITPQQLDLLRFYSTRNSVSERVMNLETFHNHWDAAMEGRTTQIQPATVPPCLVLFFMGLLALVVLFMLGGSLFMLTSLIK